MIRIERLLFFLPWLLGTILGQPLANPSQLRATPGFLGVAWGCSALAQGLISRFSVIDYEARDICNLLNIVQAIRKKRNDMKRPRFHNCH